MAIKKKGCGFLIAALLILILGGAITAFLAGDVVSQGKDFVKEIEAGKSFVTPESTTYSPENDGEVTFWLSGNGTIDIDKVIIHVTNTSSNTTATASKPTGSSDVGNKNLVATFSAEQGITYEIKASGIEDGRHITIAGVSKTNLISMAGKGFGAMASFGVCSLLALILGIIGLVKFLSSKEAPSGTPPAT